MIDPLIMFWLSLKLSFPAYQLNSDSSRPRIYFLALKLTCRVIVDTFVPWE